MSGKAETGGGFVYREDPIAEPRETFRLHGGPEPEEMARRKALQASRLAKAGPVIPNFRDTLRIRTILPAIEIPEVVDDKDNE